MVKELRCPDCDYVLVDKEGKDTNVLLLLEGDCLKYGLCKKCGASVFVEENGKRIDLEDLNIIPRVFLLANLSKTLEDNREYLNKVIEEFEENELEDVIESEIEPITFKKLFNKIDRPTELKKIPDADGDCLLDYKYILLSKGHDSWKIFNNKEELLKELSVINNLENVLIYTLGREFKVKKEISLV